MAGEYSLEESSLVDLQRASGPFACDAQAQEVGQRTEMTKLESAGHSCDQLFDKLLAIGRNTSIIYINNDINN